MLKTIIDAGYKAIIFEGTGLGHVGKNMYPVIKIANERGIFMGMTSQCIDGRVRMTVYESGRDLLNLGIIPLEDMIPEVALVKAMWATGNGENYKEIKEIMLNKIASEFST
jgi:glutamyl-tRNA(Gln) amidotransferase subunit D